MAIIAIDAGTTMIKAVGYSSAGAELIVARQPTSISHPKPGWAEQDMISVWQAVASCVQTVQKKLDSNIDYLAVTAQGDGCWLVDGKGVPTGPAILWNDGRAASSVQDWAHQGVLTAAFQRNRSQTFAGLPNALLHWLSKHEPQRIMNANSFLTCGGWLFGQMTGEYAVDESDAAAPFMDIAGRRYSDELLALFGLEWAEALLPPIRRDSQRSAPLTNDAAKAMGLAPGIPVILAPYDIASTAIGAGATSPDQACCILGTTISTEIVTSSLPAPTDMVGLTIPLGVSQMYLYALPTLAGGDVLDWACRTLQVNSPGELSELANSCTPGAEGLFFLPYLSPAGERAPFLDANARGAFLGLSANHRKEHLARAVFEGLTMAMRECLVTAGAAPSEIRACGGGAVNPFWRQLIADITGIPVSRTTDSEVGARGAFLIGQAATGAVTSITEASAGFVSIADRTTPRSGMTEFYALLYKDFLTLRDDSRQSWATLAEARKRLGADTLAANSFFGSRSYPSEPRHTTISEPVPTEQPEEEVV